VKPLTKYDWTFEGWAESEDGSAYLVGEADARFAELEAQAGVVEDDEATVERAARAIYAECWPLSGDVPFDSACASERESAYKLARAALAAVKERGRG
jgi:hypothetical protein